VAPVNWLRAFSLFLISLKRWLVAQLQHKAKSQDKGFCSRTTPLFIGELAKALPQFFVTDLVRRLAADAHPLEQCKCDVGQGAISGMLGRNLKHAAITSGIRPRRSQYRISSLTFSLLSPSLTFLDLAFPDPTQALVIHRIANFPPPTTHVGAVGDNAPFPAADDIYRGSVIKDVADAPDCYIML
jgi:hypothetical protein